MSQKLPTGNFKWQYNENYNHKSDQTRSYCSDYKRLLNEGIPFLIECDLHYPDEVKLKSKHFPFLPINRAINYEELSDYQRNLLLNKIKSNDPEGNESDPEGNESDPLRKKKLKS